MEQAETLRLAAKWTNDCSGKKDYDSDIVSISTRYWPRGGGFLVLRDGEWEGNDARPEIKPSAACSVILTHGDGDYTDIARQEFEGETFAEVAVQIERWAQAQFERVVTAVRREFVGDVQAATPSDSTTSERANTDPPPAPEPGGPR